MQVQYVSISTIMWSASDEICTVYLFFTDHVCHMCLQCFDTVGWAAGRAFGLQKTEWWGAGMFICLERGADLYIAQLMPLPLTVSCFSKIQIGFTFLVPARLGSSGKRAVKRVCVCVTDHICRQERCSQLCLSVSPSIRFYLLLLNHLTVPFIRFYLLLLNHLTIAC